MCADGKKAYRDEQDDACRKPDELWAASPHNPKNKKKEDTKDDRI